MPYMNARSETSSHSADAGTLTGGTTEARVAACVGALKGHADAHPELRLLLLTDPALRDPQTEWDENAPEIASRRRPIDVHESLFPAHHRPCLYALESGDGDGLEDPDDLVLRASVRMAFEDWAPEHALSGQGHRIGGWLWIAADTHDALVAAHFGKQVVHYDLARGGRVLLRYFDPCVLDLLWPALNEEQRQRALGPVQDWHFIDRGQALRLLQNPGGVARPVDRFTLNPSQWEQVRRIGLINQTLALWQAEHGRPVPGHLMVEVDDAVRQSILFGLKDADRIEFALLAITRHPRFAEHPAFQPVWAAVRGGDSFLDALNALTMHAPDIWQRIGAAPTPSNT